MLPEAQRSGGPWEVFGETLAFVFMSQSPRIVGGVSIGGHSHLPRGLGLQSKGQSGFHVLQRHKPWERAWCEEGPFGSGTRCGGVGHPARW